MFINCPDCNALVATDLVTDQPPERCPRCGHALRDAVAAPAATAPAGAGTPASDPRPLFVPLRARPDPAADPPGQGHGLVAFPPHPPATPPPVDRPGARHAMPAPDPMPASTAPTRLEDRAREAPTPPSSASRSPHAGDGPSPTNAKGSATTTAATDTDTDTAATVPPDGTTPSDTALPPAEGGPHVTPDPAAPPARSASNATADVAPRFLRPSATPAIGPPSSRERRLLWIALPALTLLFGLQLLLADRARLAADPVWRPWAAAACTLARCTLPPWHEPSAIALLQRDVRPHPEHAGVLLVDATLRNDAPHPQAWPLLALTLSDADGRALGARWFAPDEYRPADAPVHLAPGAQATFRLEVVEPSPHTVAFNFDFG